MWIAVDEVKLYVACIIGISRRESYAVCKFCPA